MTIIVDKNQQQHGFVATIWAKTGPAVLEYFLIKTPSILEDSLNNKIAAFKKIPSRYLKIFKHSLLV